MAGRDWTTHMATAAGVAAGAGAAQLGLGYGLGVVVWPVTPLGDDSVWLGSLGWATWIAASSTVFGAVIAGRLGRGPGSPRGWPWRLAVAVSAGLGALLTVALIALPARSAVRLDTSSPEAVAATYVVIGILFGVVVAYWAVMSGPVAANLAATAAYLWILAATAIMVELATGRASATYLTSWQFAKLDEGARYGTIYWPSALLTLLAAVLIGMIAAWPAARRGNVGLGTAASGAVGPLLVAAAFLMLAPQLTGALGQLQSAYLIAPYAVLAGLAGSASVVALGRRAAEKRRQNRHRPAPPVATGVATVPAHGGRDPDHAAPDDVAPSTGTAAEPEVASVAKRRRAPAGAFAARRPGILRRLGRGDGATGDSIQPPAHDGPARPGQSQSATHQPERIGTGATAARSTVTAPPPTPTVARINPPREEDVPSGPA